MVDYTITVQSVPSGIEMKVEVVGSSQWIVTNKTLTFTDITSVDVIAPPTVGEAVETPALGWKFIKWEDDSKNPKRTVDISGSPTIIATYEQQIYYPVRHYTRRKEKFEAKTDEEVYASRALALKPMMVEQQEVTSAQQERIERLVGEYLNKQGLYGIQIHHYRNFSQALFRLTRLFTNASLNIEASLEAQKWYIRLGETPEVQTRLEAIAKLFGITLSWA